MGPAKKAASRNGRAIRKPALKAEEEKTVWYTPQEFLDRYFPGWQDSRHLWPGASLRGCAVGGNGHGSVSFFTKQNKQKGVGRYASNRV